MGFTMNWINFLGNVMFANSQPNLVNTSGERELGAFYNTSSANIATGNNDYSYGSVLYKSSGSSLIPSYYTSEEQDLYRVIPTILRKSYIRVGNKEGNFLIDEYSYSDIDGLQYKNFYYKTTILENNIIQVEYTTSIYNNSSENLSFNSVYLLSKAYLTEDDKYNKIHNGQTMAAYDGPKKLYEGYVKTPTTKPLVLYAEKAQKSVTIKPNKTKKLSVKFLFNFEKYSPYFIEAMRDSLLSTGNNCRWVNSVDPVLKQEVTTKYSYYKTSGNSYYSKQFGSNPLLGGLVNTPNFFLIPKDGFDTPFEDISSLSSIIERTEQDIQFSFGEEENEEWYGYIDVSLNIKNISNRKVILNRFLFTKCAQGLFLNNSNLGTSSASMTKYINTHFPVYSDFLDAPIVLESNKKITFQISLKIRLN